MEQEISLREIIETLWKGKWIIVGATAIALVLAALYSYVIANPTYESKGTVIINNTNIPIGSLTEYANNSTSRDVIVERMKSPEVLQSTIEELELNRSVSSLQGSLNIIKAENNESLINLSIKGSDQELLADILGAVVKNTKSEISTNLTEYIDSFKVMYQDKLEAEEEALNEYMNEYNALEDSEGLPLLVLFQQNASDSQYVLEANESLLQELRDLEKITQVEYEQINSKINQANNNYKQYYNKYDDAISAENIEIVEERIDLLSNPYTSSNPISPNKMLNMAISLVLGLMGGVFIVFIREYWKQSKEE
ncbi:YveK family protein [Aquisalibacillus elongatus]|uniref:Putative tyrosine kinase-like protein n=1 Tax=Aquisalibacillus elongatus TaxID=485577 RepID=A0A3N5BB72_9BACI|nr:Wzz/FepE/Etk N-terminal domain-containing protein [Aquisalibacillus elongatus]RPF54199.1 putative tyrosine kinase-like protein [Aquisalibacillus elongatus]